MPDAVLADRSERLPWLPNQPTRRVTPPPRSWVALLGSALVGAAVVAGTWAWVDRNQAPPAAESPAASERTVALPPPATPQQPEQQQQPAAEPQPQSATERGSLDPAPPAAVDRRAVSPAERHPQPRRPRSDTSGSGVQGDAGPRAAPAVPAAEAPSTAVAAAQPRTLWPARQVNGAGGRLVQIGSFGTRRQAKLGWRRMQRAYPAVGRLPAVVVEARNSRGRKFYRFQIGTTSHAHSEVLCQRMETINFSCAVLGLPWKAKIER